MPILKKKEDKICKILVRVLDIWKALSKWKKHLLLLLLLLGHVSEKQKKSSVFY